MDWLAGFAAPACVMKVKLEGLRLKGDGVETTKVTGIASGELLAAALTMLMVAL
jgi:hypothetical protein